MSFDPKKALEKQQEQQLSQSWLRRKLHEFNTAHNKLKHTVHTAWRYPLPPWGRAVMACVYFSIPVAIGYGIGTWAGSRSDATLEDRFGNKESSKNIQGLGDKAVVADAETGEKRYQKVGAGGWGGGVRLAQSDQETQDVNRINLERFLKKQRRLMKKREKEAQENVDNTS